MKVMSWKMEGKVFLIKRSSKLECRYWLVIRLKAIEYKKNFLYYLSSYCQSSLQVFLSSNCNVIVTGSTNHLISTCDQSYDLDM